MEEGKGGGGVVGKEKKRRVAGLHSIAAENNEDMKRNPRPWDSLSSEERMELREIFELSDLDGTGSLDWKEVRAALRGIGFPITKRETKELMHEAAINMKGFLEFDGFLWIVERLNREEVDIRREIDQGYKLFDKEKKGYIVVEDIERLSNEVEFPMGKKELQPMFTLADVDGTGMVTKEQFIQVMLQTNLFK
eukprot:m.21018 g.21018  ORF g.21018 m.21018 type:complete len:193 (-) comp5316_c1_seq1:169-747(-)